MSFKIKKIILVWFLSVFLVISVAANASAYNSILAFGDSLSDNGQYYEVPVYGVEGNYNIYDQFGFQRFSNGPVWVEYLAQDLGIPLLDMAYGGATTDWDNPAASLPITGLQWQVYTYGDTFGPIANDSLVTLWAGGNDMFQGRSPFTAAQNIGLAIETLIGLGGDSFLIPNLTNSNAWIDAFDPALAATVATLRILYPDVNFYELDLNRLVLTGIDYMDGTYLAQTYGPGTYAWWDTVGVHPTTEVHVQIAAYAANRIPEPASVVLLILGFAGLIVAKRRIR